MVVSALSKVVSSENLEMEVSDWLSIQLLAFRGILTNEKVVLSSGVFDLVAPCERA